MSLYSLPGPVVFHAHGSKTYFVLQQLNARSAVTQDPETGIIRTADTRMRLLVCVSPLFIQAATLNFLAEWGDRSQIAAIILAAREVSRVD